MRKEFQSVYFAELRKVPKILTMSPYCQLWGERVGIICLVQISRDHIPLLKLSKLEDPAIKQI